jgi:hypothetical protein
MSDTTLRELLDDLRRDPSVQAEFERDPSGFLAARGHDLPDELVAEAIVNVAAGLPADIAEHLSSFTIADSPIPDLDPTGFGSELDGDSLDGLRLLAVAPLATAEVVIDSLDAEGGIDGFGTGVGDDIAAGSDTIGDDGDPQMADPGDDGIVDGESAGDGGEDADEDGGIDGWSVIDGLDDAGTGGLEESASHVDDADGVELHDSIEAGMAVDPDDPAEFDGLE